jgi:hypothetical protein
MTARVRPLVDPARPLPRVALTERHEPQTDVRSPAGQREHERQRASGQQSVLDRRVDLVQPPQARAVGSRLRAGVPLRQIDACVFEPPARQKCPLIMRDRLPIDCS